MTASSGAAQRMVFLMICLVYAAIDFTLLVYFVRKGFWQSGIICAWAASLVPMYLIGAIMEHRLLPGPAHQAWSFFFGDSIFLPFAIAMCAVGWRKLPAGHWYNSPAWLIGSLIIGLAAGYGFHAMDRVNYSSLAWNSPTKLWHDFAAYPILFGGIWAVAWPMLLRGRNWSAPFPAELALVGVIMWFVIGITHDQHLDPTKLHVQYNWSDAQVVPYAASS